MESHHGLMRKLRRGKRAHRHAMRRRGVMTSCLSKTTNILNQVERFSDIAESNGHLETESRL